MKIKSVQAREIFDSRGFPTVECEINLTNGNAVLASVPTGASVGSHEAVEVRDEDRLLGRGVSQAIYNIEHVIAPLILNQRPEIFAIDRLMIELDGTSNKSCLGANAILAVSIAVLKAQAITEQAELYELIAHLCDSDSVTLPFPLFNVINGGAHANNNLRIQEFMIMPIAGQQFRQAFEQAIMIYHVLEKMLKERSMSVAVGDEGGFAPQQLTDLMALDLITNAIKSVAGTDYFKIGLDVAANEFYDNESGTYNWDGQQLSSDGMINLYDRLVAEYPVFLIEDGLAEDDWKGWQEMTHRLGQHVQIVGDDIFATSITRLHKALEMNIGNTIIIKPNQVGTVSETLQTIEYAKSNGYGVIISHRSGETNDTFISDLAVGTSAGQIKAGGCSRGERLAKYNRLLRIEDNLVFRVLGF